MVVDAKFYSGTLKKRFVEDVYNKYNCSYISPRHIAIVIPENCNVPECAKKWAMDKRITIVKLPVEKKLVKKPLFQIFFKKSAGGTVFKIDTHGLGVADIINRLEFISGPYMKRSGRPKLIKTNITNSFFSPLILWKNK